MQAFLRSKAAAGDGRPARMVRAAARALQRRPLSTEDALARLPYTPEQISGFWLKVCSSTSQSAVDQYAKGPAHPSASPQCVCAGQLSVPLIMTLC